jgi:hypothetical protein
MAHATDAQWHGRARFFQEPGLNGQDRELDTVADPQWFHDFCQLRLHSAFTSWASRQIDRFIAWTTDAYRATRSFSLLRIIYAVGMLLFLIPSYGDRAYLWGFASTWLEPEIKRRGYPFFIEKMFPKDNTFVFDLSYWSLIVLVLLFLVGYKTRFVTPVMLLFWIGLQSNSMLVTNGGDTIFRITLSFLIFANLSKHWSVDAWLQKRRGHRRSFTQKHFPVPLWLGAGIHNTALMLCCYQIMLVYVNSGIFKLMGKDWLDGSALLLLPEPGCLPGCSASERAGLADHAGRVGGNVGIHLLPAALPGAAAVEVHPLSFPRPAPGHAHRDRILHGALVVLLGDDRPGHALRARQLLGKGWKLGPSHLHQGQTDSPVRYWPAP